MLSKGKTPSNSFCVLPWMHLATNSSGFFRVCCNSTPGHNLIRDEKGEPYTVNTPVEMKEIWNSPSYKKIRQQMLTGEWPTACSRCQTEEKAGIKSSRLGWNESFEHLIEPALAKTSQDGEAEVNIKYLDLRLGNFCNLKCRMCNPYASRKWIEDWDKIFEPLAPSERQRLNKLNWFENPQSWELLSSVLKDCEEIYFTGGEPLIIEQHQRFLRYCIDENLAAQIILKYNTNTTYIPDDLMELWQKFKLVRVNCSVDAVGELNDYIRYPSNWKVVHANLLKLNEAAKKQKNIVPKIHTTVQATNFLVLTDIFELMKSLESFKSLPFLNILDRPDYLNIKVLPQDIKNKALAKIDRWMQENSQLIAKADPDYVKKIRHLRSYAFNEESKSSFAEFAEKTQSLDQLRGQALKTLVPELTGHAEWWPHATPTPQTILREFFKDDETPAPEFFKGVFPLNKNFRTAPETPIPWFPMDLPGLPTKEILAETQALRELFVAHRDEQNHFGWKGLCLHGVSATQLGTAEDYNLEKKGAYDWTEIAERCPHTVAYLKNAFPAQSYRRVRFMLLEPGGYILPHSDRTEPLLGPLTVCLNAPEKSFLKMKDHGILPAAPGAAFMLDVSNIHAAWNRSSEDRFHLIIETQTGSKYRELFDCILKSFARREGPRRLLQPRYFLTHLFALPPLFHHLIFRLAKLF